MSNIAINMLNKSETYLLETALATLFKNVNKCRDVNNRIEASLYGKIVSRKKDEKSNKLETGLFDFSD